MAFPSAKERTGFWQRAGDNSRNLAVGKFLLQMKLTWLSTVLRLFKPNCRFTCPGSQYRVRLGRAFESLTLDELPSEPINMSQSS